MGSIIRLKKLALVFSATVMAAALLVVSAPARTATQDGSAALYRAKCVACHGATAEKKFDATKTDDVLVEIVLKGKKSDKPPNMPGYEDKGITADQAKALIAFMKSQKH